jgi:hypothetical protein
LPKDALEGQLLHHLSHREPGVKLVWENLSLTLPLYLLGVRLEKNLTGEWEISFGAAWAFEKAVFVLY